MEHKIRTRLFFYFFVIEYFITLPLATDDLYNIVLPLNLISYLLPYHNFKNIFKYYNIFKLIFFSVQWKKFIIAL